MNFINHIHNDNHLKLMKSEKPIMIIIMIIIYQW